MGGDSRAQSPKTQSLLAPDQDLITEVEALDGRRVRVHVRVNPRARLISVRIDPTRRIAVATAPSKRQIKRAVQFSSERAQWIAEELARLPSAVTLHPGVMAPLRGQMHLLQFEQGRGAARVEVGEPPLLIAPAPDVELFEARVLRFLKSEARDDITARVAVHADTLGVKATKIQIKDMRSRWGSCSVDGALAFSWRVILAPPFVLDYLVAHEVAHLREMNHSRRFWAQVKRCMPEYEKGRAWLNRHGAALHAVG